MRCCVCFVVSVTSAAGPWKKSLGWKKGVLEGSIVYLFYSFILFIYWYALTPGNRVGVVWLPPAEKTRYCRPKRKKKGFTNHVGEKLRGFDIYSQLRHKQQQPSFFGVPCPWVRLMRTGRTAWRTNSVAQSRDSVSRQVSAWWSVIWADTWRGGVRLQNMILHRWDVDVPSHLCLSPPPPFWSGAGTQSQTGSSRTTEHHRRHLQILIKTFKCLKLIRSHTFWFTALFFFLAKWPCWLILGIMGK